MKRIYKLPKPKKKLSYLEKKVLKTKAEKDKEKRLVTVLSDDVDYKLPFFVIHEITRFELIRNFVFDNYKIVLDCKGIDKQIVNCPKTDTCSKKSCKRCIYVFSEIILTIDRLVHNALASLKIFETKKINERNSVIIQILQLDDVSEEHIKIMLRTKLDNIVANIHKEKIETHSLIVCLLNAKIKFIDAIEQTVKLYFDYHLNRISYYMENIPASWPSIPVFPLDRLLDICNSSILTFYDKYRKDADCQKTMYETQNQFFHKTPLALAIERAKYVTRGVLIDTDATNVDYKNQWVTQREWDAFAVSLASACDAMSIVSTEQEITDEINALDLAVSIFSSAKKNGLFVDITMLINAINIAKAEKKDVVVSDNSDKVYYKSSWVTQSQLKQLNNSIEEAQRKVKEVRNDEQVVLAANSLTKAIDVFIRAKKNGTYIDKSALETAIKTAKTEMGTISVSTTGADVDNKKWWVTQKEYDAFKDILKSITYIYENSTVDEQVLDAVNKLKEKITDFIKIKKKGKFVDKSRLENAIKDAENAQNNIVIDTDANNVDNRHYWVTQKEYDDLAELIMYAKKSLPSLVTDDEVVDASDSLIAATITFNNCQKKGTFVDKSILSKEIVEAENSMVGVLIDTNSINVNYKNDWVTQRAWDILANSIVLTQNSVKNVLTDKQVKNAAKRMRKAVDSFNKSKQKGTFVDTTILSTVIKNAEKKLESIAIDEDGTNIVTEHLWAAKEDWDLFNQAIEDARNAMNTVKNDEQVVEAAEILTAEIEAFDSVLKFGLMVKSKEDNSSI